MFVVDERGIVVQQRRLLVHLRGPVVGRGVSPGRATLAVVFLLRTLALRRGEPAFVRTEPLLALERRLIRRFAAPRACATHCTRLQVREVTVTRGSPTGSGVSPVPRVAATASPGAPR